MKSITTHDGLTFPPPRELDDAEAGALELLFELARDDYARSVLFAMRNPTIRQTILNVLAQAHSLGLSAIESLDYVGVGGVDVDVLGVDPLTLFKEKKGLRP